MSSNRNMNDANSLFIAMKKGQLHRADFIESSCTENIIEQVKARRLNEVTGPQQGASK